MKIRLLFSIVRCIGVMMVVVVLNNLAFCDVIHDAAEKGDLTKVQSLLKDNHELVFSKDNYHRTPLHVAAGAGNKEVVALLLTNKAEVDAKDTTLRTPLLNAAENGHGDVVDLLLAEKAGVNAKSSWEQNPLLLAAANGHKDVVALLLAHDADINTKNGHGETPLHLAAANGHKDVVELLLANKADYSILDAIAGDELDKVKAFIKDNPKLLSDKDAFLREAAVHGRQDVAEWLLQNKADINSKDTAIGF